MFGMHISGLVGAPDAAVDARIRELELQRRAVEAELALTVAVADARGIHHADGHRSMAGYLRATCNWSSGEVARFRGAARLLDHHEAVGEAWASGHIGSAQVAELSRAHGNKRVVDRFGEFVPTLVEHAEQLPYDDFRTLLQRFVVLADVDGTHDDRDAVDGRSAQVIEVGGVLDMRASGGTRLEAAEILGIFERFVDAEFQHDLQQRRELEAAGLETGTGRTPRQRRFDALLAMARSAAAHDGVGSAAEPVVSILCDQQTWSWVLAHSGLGAATSLDGQSIDPFTGLPQPAALLDDLLCSPDSLADRRCVTTNGVPLRPHDVLRAALSGRVRRVVLGAKRRPVDVGRAERVFTGAARDAAKLLVDWCEHPGCDLPSELCQVDHSTEWNAGGRTDQNNAGVRCGLHNREKHRRHRAVRRSLDGRNHTFRSDGMIILPVGCRPPRFEPDDEPDDDPRDQDDEWDEATERLLNEVARHRVAMLAADQPT